MLKRLMFRKWEHVVKLDPARENTPEVLDCVIESGSDAVIIGGTQGISHASVAELIRAISEMSTIPVGVEISSPDALCWGADLYFLPVVLNSTDPSWIIKNHAKALEKMLPPLLFCGGLPRRLAQAVVPEGYIVLNQESAVASLTLSDCSLSPRECAGLALAGELIFHLPVIYIEYSGMYGDPEVVYAVRSAVNTAHIFYGGGIKSPEQAYEMARLADTVVLGNMIYEGGLCLLKETVEAVREAKGELLWR